MATARIVLKPSIRNHEKLTRREDVPYFFGSQVNGIDTDEPYTTVHDDIMSPATMVPKIPSEFVRYVAYRGSTLAGFRPDGIYKHGRSTLEAKMDSGRDGLRLQQVTIRSQGIKAARVIYDQFRQDLLQPDKKWSEKPSEI